MIQAIPQDDGTERVEVPIEFGPLAIVLGEPVAIAEPQLQPAPEPDLAAAEPQPTRAPANVSGKTGAKKR